MSQFECPIVHVTVIPHENADSLEIAQVGGYLCVVRKGQFTSGDLAVYIPEQSVIPDWLLKTLGLWDKLKNKGALSGGAGNRVRAMKLRGALSQGLLMGFVPDGDGKRCCLPKREKHFEPGCHDCLTAFVDLKEGQCLAEYLGVTKYEPIVPVHMAGRALGADLDSTIGYDFENIKKTPAMFSDGEPVVMTEKIHGTFVQVGLIPESMVVGKLWATKVESVVFGGVSFKPVVTSKGQGAKGILLDTSDEFNLYVKTAAELGLWGKIYAMRKSLGAPADKPIFLCGEIFGPGVQLNFAYGQSAPAFKAFDLYVGTRSDGFFVDYGVMRTLCEDTGVETVPLLYHGPFSQVNLDFHTSGKTQVRGRAGKLHIREGLVIKSSREARYRNGRKIAKSVSEQFLLNGKTTEFQ